jgi:lipid A 3-O-deacylase
MTMRERWAVVGLASALIGLAALPAYAQQANASQSGGAAAPANVDVNPLEDTAQIITLQGENDAVSTLKGTSDQNYTSGLRLGWVSGTNQVPDFLERVGHAVYGDGGVQRISLDISQQIYTPRGTQLSIPDPHDRPYAGYLALNGQLITDTEDRRTVLGLSVGMVGPDAGGETVQNGFHNLIGDTPNRGWNYQLRDEPTIELLSAGTWRLPIDEFYGLETDALPMTQLGVGNVRDYVMGGVNFRLGQGLQSDYGVAKIQPGQSGSDAFKPTQDFAWYVFAGGDGQAVAHDMFLQGNTWRGEGPHVSMKWYVGEINAGAAIIWQGVRITYSQTWQTDEFHGQKGGLFNFGSLAASVRF